MNKKKISLIAYGVGLFAVIIVGLLQGFNAMPELNWLPWVLVVLGLIIGILNVTGEEAMPVMVATLVLGMGAGFLAIIPAVGGVLEAIFLMIAAFSIPVSLPVALKVLYKKLS